MTTIGTIESLWRYPVKSMQGEQLPSAFAGFPGIYGDRLYAFRSPASPPGFPWFTIREQEAMLLYRPFYRHPTRALVPPNLADAEALGSGLTPVYDDLADLAVDVETPAGERLGVDDPRLISLLLQGVRDAHRITLLRSQRALTDCRPVSLFSLATVRQLSHESGIDLDKRRFRANLYIDLHSGEPFGEDKFVGRTLQIGAKTQIAIVGRDARCKIITVDPVTAQPNPEVMKCLARDHETKAGIYGVVLAEGTIHPSDEIALLD